MTSGVKTRAAWTAALVVLVGAGGFALLQRDDGPPSATATPAATGTTSPSVPAATPTASATRTAEPTPTPSVSPGETSAASTAATSVTVTFAGWEPSSAVAEVGGFAPVVESGGTCTLTLSRGSVVVSATAPAAPDATTTTCTVTTTPGQQLTAGTWTGNLRYASDRTTGVSDAFSIEVP